MLFFSIQYSIRELIPFRTILRNMLSTLRLTSTQISKIHQTPSFCQENELTQIFSLLIKYTLRLQITIYLLSHYNNIIPLLNKKRYQTIIFVQKYRLHLEKLILGGEVKCKCSMCRFAFLFRKIRRDVILF